MSATIVKRVSAWRYLAAHNGFVERLQQSLWDGQISQAKYDGAIAGMRSTGRQCDQIIADAIADHPLGVHTPPLSEWDAAISAHFLGDDTGATTTV
ncbi:MAG: hypothetical protein ABJB03_00420 [Rhodoglobus sp.]